MPHVKWLVILDELGGLCPAAGLGQGDSHLFTR